MPTAYLILSSFVNSCQPRESAFGREQFLRTSTQYGMKRSHSTTSTIKGLRSVFSGKQNPAFPGSWLCTAVDPMYCWLSPSRTTFLIGASHSFDKIRNPGLFQTNWAIHSPLTRTRAIYYPFIKVSFLLNDLSAFVDSQFWMRIFLERIG